MNDEKPFDNSFDLEDYIGNYTSRTRIYRLLYIAEKSAGTILELTALKFAADVLKQGTDVATYKEVIEKIKGRLGPQYINDEEWINRVETNHRLRQEELNCQLHAVMATSVKEGARMVYNDLAAFYYDCGWLPDSIKEYQKTKDYCTSPKQTAVLCLNALKITLESKSFAYLAAYIRRTESLPKNIRTREFNSKISCFHGLKELDGRKYELAARQFIEIHSEIGDSFNEVATARDMATYGALCALASFDRDELKNNVLSNVDFKELMQHTPELQECVRDFQKSQYSLCLGRLESLKRGLLLDMYIGPHIPEIFRRIRQRALIQYTTPFSSISLYPMAEAFNVSINELEKELVALITKEHISARIDSENKIMYSKQGKIRIKTFQNAKALTKAFLQDHKGMLIRLNLIKHELIQQQYASGDRKTKRLDQPGNSSFNPLGDESTTRFV